MTLKIHTKGKMLHRNVIHNIWYTHIMSKMLRVHSPVSNCKLHGSAPHRLICGILEDIPGSGSHYEVTIYTGKRSKLLTQAIRRAAFETSFRGIQNYVVP
jgi:hypothetical protein